MKTSSITQCTHYYAHDTLIFSESQFIFANTDSRNNQSPSLIKREANDAVAKRTENLPVHNSQAIVQGHHEKLFVYTGREGFLPDPTDLITPTCNTSVTSPAFLITDSYALFSCSAKPDSLIENTSHIA